jgi:hypothetical protein
MGMIAAKHTDMIVGMDMHMVQPPPPAPPVVVPHPVVGMILDPADYQAGACTVYVNGLPRARAGSVCLLTPPHIPIGGVFVMPVFSEAEVAEGSSTVLADGEAMSASNHQVLGCHDVGGGPAPVRTWKSAPAKSLLKAGSVVVAIPAGAPVMVGGAPTTGATRSMEDGTPREWVELVFVRDDDGVPYADVSYRVELSDGTVRQGTAGAHGGTVLHGVPVGTCHVTLGGRVASVDCATGTLGPALESIVHRVAPHEDTLRIAALHGIGDLWKEVFNHSDNEALRRERPDPLELDRGDEVVLPAALLQRFEIQTGAVHEFRVRPQTRRMRVHLQRQTGAPFADSPWSARFGPHDPEQAGTTDAEGLVELDVPWSARRVNVLVEARRNEDDEPICEDFTFDLAQLRPATTRNGIAQRANNLGVRAWRDEVAICLARHFRCRSGQEQDLDEAVRSRSPESP